MALVDVIRSAVATADGVTASLQGTVQHAAWIDQDGFGKARYGRRTDGVLVIGFDPLSADVCTPHQAIIEVEQKMREVNGRIVSTYCHITFLHPFTANGESTQRQEPVDPRDIFILPDGRSGPVIDTKGFVDAATGYPFFPEVFLGALSERGTLL